MFTYVHDKTLYIRMYTDCTLIVGSQVSTQVEVLAESSPGVRSCNNWTRFRVNTCTYTLALALQYKCVHGIQVYVLQV